MMLSLHTTSFVEKYWPRTWPPFEFPPPPPLRVAADALWSPTNPSDSDDPAATAVLDAPPLYSARLRPGDGAPAESEVLEGERFEMAYIDKRIALLRYDASHDALAA